MTTTQAQVIETSTTPGQYGFATTEAIVEHPAHGRLYMRQGYGGERQQRGGAVRWDHGIVCQLQPGDTLDSLAKGEHNEHTSALQAMTHGYDDARPMLEWDGAHIDRLATSLGL